MKLMVDEYEKAPQDLAQLFRTKDTKRAFEELAETTGVGPSELKPEGQGIVFKDPSQLAVKRIFVTTYALGLRVTMEAKQDDQYGVVEGLASNIGESFPVRQEIERATAINLIFSPTYMTGADGLAIISASHPIKGPSYATPGVGTAGGNTAMPARATMTASNKAATAAALDFQSLVDLMTLSRRQVNEQGDYITRRMTRLVVPPELLPVAWELTHSSTRPDTANRADNYLGTYGLMVVSSPYILDSNMWLLMAENSKHSLMWLDRMPFTVDSDGDFGTKDTLISGIERWGVGAYGWRGIVGNPGN
jgi:hypothetical protein